MKCFHKCGEYITQTTFTTSNKGRIATGLLSSLTLGPCLPSNSQKLVALYPICTNHSYFLSNLKLRYSSLSLAAFKKGNHVNSGVFGHGHFLPRSLEGSKSQETGANLKQGAGQGRGKETDKARTWISRCALVPNS